ncbi:MAG: trimethylamine methyltransferase family protein, partial [Anaerolineales bacterium]|nr:trimethylamine methyltransferase family protein [Anaerolineales bacterium]
MQPKLELLSKELVGKVLDEAFMLMLNPGIKVQSQEARQLLEEAGAQVDESSEVVKIPEKVVRKALKTVPSIFSLYD